MHRMDTFLSSPALLLTGNGRITFERIAEGLTGRQLSSSAALLGFYSSNYHFLLHASSNDPGRDASELLPGATAWSIKYNVDEMLANATLAAFNSTAVIERLVPDLWIYSQQR